MAAKLTAIGGVDLEYPRRQVAARGERSPLGYYADASAAGEAAGRWFGAGLEALGLAESEMVDLDEDGPYLKVYRQINPLTGEKMGRAPVGSKARKADILAELEADRPHATRGEHRTMARQAAHQARQSNAYVDTTLEWSKSISVFGASLLANESAAGAAGDLAAAEHWAGRRRAYQEVKQAANLAMLRHAETWAGFTRTGSHTRKIDGAETGRWEKADLVVTSWLQGTSRDGDPHAHEHNLFARMTRTVSDGKWRALDTMSLRAQLPAMRAIAAAHLEAGLSREFGVEWVARPDGAGNEIRGVTQAQMDMFSSRAQEIEPRMRELVTQFTANYGREPNKRELMQLHRAAWAGTRDAKPDGAIDWDAKAREWNAQLDGELVSIAPAVSGRLVAGAAAARPPEEALSQAAARALGRVQGEQSTWTRADLLKHLQVLIPVARGMEPDDAVALLHEVADRALGGEFAPVVSMAAPDVVPVPAGMVRDLDGRSVYTRPGSERYATQAQMALEQQMVADAQREGAPHLSREQAAQLLGVDADTLDAQLLACTQDARATPTPTGLRMDQAASVFHALTTPRTATVLAAPAGAGKTHALAEAARLWQQTGRPVIGVATSQAARNVLAEAGITNSVNLSVLLGHTKERRGTLGMMKLEPGALILVDEFTMTSTPDAADLIRAAVGDTCKVLTAGDYAQLPAVEAGGAMRLLADELGHVQLAEPVRFSRQWERAASLRLRAGDPGVLDEYADHGSIRGNVPEDAMADARQLYVAEYVRGRDAALIVSSRELGREMARHVRSDLRHLGLIGAGPEVRIAAGQAAGAGDIIRVTKNQRVGRGRVANGDILRVEAVNADRSITVRRAAGRDPGTGERRWSDGTFRWHRYGSAESGHWREPEEEGFSQAETGLWATAHSAQGRTVATGVTLVTGTEDAQWLYTAMTRGADANYACVFTQKDAADTRAGSRPAPEITRDARVQAERAGDPPPERGAGQEGRGEERDGLAVLQDMLERDGRQLSATETQRRNMANADHLGMLGAIWDEETKGLRIAGYRQMLNALVPEAMRPHLDTDQAKWLWRTLRGVEAAGLDAQEVAERAIRSRPLAGARNAAAVIDDRIRKQAGSLIPSSWRSYAGQVPECGDPVKREYLAGLAAAMDARKGRIGEHAAGTSPAWAANALGPVPDEPLDRLEWTSRAELVGAYRELYGWEHDRDPIGPEPPRRSPEQHAAWHAAYAAMTRTDQIDLSEHGDSSLWLMRDTYESETRWAPEYPGKRLRAVQSALVDAETASARSDAEAVAARARGEHGLAGQHETIASSARAAADYYRERSDLDGKLMEDYQAWSRVSAPGRHIAVRADAELRGRHPDLELAALTTAEPPEPPAGVPEVPDADTHAAAREQAQRARAAFRERLEERQGVQVPSEDPDLEPEGEAWPRAWPGRDPDAILQPPPPQMPAAPQIERQPEMEAG